MKRIQTCLSILAALLILPAAFVPVPSSAQAVQFLGYNPDARTAGMGGAGVSLDATAFSMWNNSAAPALSSGTMDAAVSYGLWQPSGSANSVVSAAGYGRVAGFMTVSAGIKYFSHSSYDITDSGGLVTGSYTPKEMSAGVGVAFRILPVLSLGANVHYVHSDLGQSSRAGAVSADFGAMLDLRFMRIGATVSHIGSRIGYGGVSSYGQPADFRLGVGTTRTFGAEGRHAVTASLQGGLLLEGASLFGEAGVEYAWNGMVRVSAGYHHGGADIPGVIPSYASVGAGFRILGIHVDAAYIIGTDARSPLTNSFSIGLGYSF